MGLTRWLPMPETGPITIDAFSKMDNGAFRDELLHGRLRHADDRYADGRGGEDRAAAGILQQEGKGWILDRKVEPDAGAQCVRGALCEVLAGIARLVAVHP